MKAKSKINRKYTWRPSLPDFRDYKYTAAAIVIPTSVDLRPQDVPVYNQGQLGSCTANAWAGAFQFTKKKEKKSDWAPSRLFIYYNERVIEGTPTTDSGAQLRDGAQTLSTQGTCAESMWLYSDDATKFAIKPPTNCYTQGLPHKITSYMSIDNTVINNLKSCLASGYTFVFGFTVYESFESQAVASTGVVPMPLPNEEVLGGHAVEAVGYNDSMNAFIIRNSWGTGWGIPNSAGIGTGYFWMPYDYITNTNLASDFWTIRMDS